MGARALALSETVFTEEHPLETEGLIQEVEGKYRINEQQPSPNPKLRGWLKDRLTALAAVPRLKPELAEKVINETREALERLNNNPFQELSSRPE